MTRHSLSATARPFSIACPGACHTAVLEFRLPDHSLLHILAPVMLQCWSSDCPTIFYCMSWLLSHCSAGVPTARPFSIASPGSCHTAVLEFRLPDHSLLQVLSPVILQCWSSDCPTILYCKSCHTAVLEFRLPDHSLLQVLAPLAGQHLGVCRACDAGNMLITKTHQEC